MTTENTDDTEDFLGPLQQFPLTIKEWRDAAETYAKQGAALVQRRAEIIKQGGALGLPKMKIGRSLPLDLLDRPKKGEGSEDLDLDDAGAQTGTTSELADQGDEDAGQPEGNRFKKK